ncbi:uncharacterized protein LOC118201051 [Stegodyphus dumicola]|uniref:uncharacterized protein LOC118201051 n=1 Tax=Stegodyphus dumicola TaxID=202533 RepID=UPI0015A936BE|nr:uncharacterized protein LOC118201051 [Stegodyphus dumicola]
MKIFLSKWAEKGIIESVEDKKTENCHNLPHRAVIKQSSTTKIRPVFDASAKERNGVSLNDCLEKGPNYLELIPSILNRFRLGKYGVISDICKAFLQIGVCLRDRDFLRFLWWEEGDSEKFKIYRHKRVVFGVNGSPFFLAATLNYHLENVPEHQQEVAKKLSESMYVDNCVASIDTIEGLNTFINVSKEIMSTAKFDLRGWCYNEPSNETLKGNPCNKDSDKTVSVLGLKWNLSNDTLSCDFKDSSVKQPVNKRNILSIVHRIFDSIGFTAPATLIPKLMLQECWKQ